VRRKTRQSYVKDIDEADPQKVRELLDYGEFQLGERRMGGGPSGCLERTGSILPIKNI